MAIQSGAHLGPYEILSAIGAGGMGEVYRARDTNLGRDVAIKVLPEAFTRDPDRMARFAREAKLLAALDHSNIASIYGLETSGATRALVMQLAEGPTLADRIARGPIPIDDALRIAKQICEALEYAHEKGIIHRDLKPANIKVAADDTVKILDFGLAKALESGPSAEDIANSPTLSRMATQTGVLLGTAAYMSPEQAKAKPVDRRADIWAFGCVLYEMLTGKKAFDGDAVTETLAAVLKNEPDWSLLPGGTPMRVRVLLQRCLQKDPRQRLRDIGDARISLEEVLSGAPEAAPGVAAPPLPVWRRALPWAVASLFAVAFAALAFVHFGEKPPAPPRPVERFDIAAADANAGSVAVLSPDGTRLVMANVEMRNGARLWLRRMDSLDARPLEGTDLAAGLPFWSPDSRYVVFGTTDGKLEEIDTEGGPPQVLCSGEVPPVIGGFWTSDEKIIFSMPNSLPGLWEVPAAGGVPSVVPGLPEMANVPLLLPVPLPDGRHFLYTTGDQRQGNVYLGSLDSNGREGPKQLLTGVVPGLAFVPSPEDPDLGYLLFIRQDAQGVSAGTLMAEPFDTRRLDFAGEPVPVAPGVSIADFSASLTGTLVYGSGTSAVGTDQLTLFNRQGKVLATAGEPGNYQSVAFSPDAKRVAAARVIDSGGENLWMIDLERGISTRFTFGSGAADGYPVWSPDGSRVIFTSATAGTSQMYEKLSNGGGDAELLLKSPDPSVSLSWSADGRFLLYGVGSVGNATSAIVPLDRNGRAAGKPFPFVGKGTGIDGRFSPGPGGHPLWVAYTSDESGKYEIYVRPFDPNSPTGTPPGGGKWQVSTNGGMSARWNGNGKELFYMAPDGTVMSVEVSGGSAAFQSGVPKPLFKPKGLIPQPPTNDYWDASADGKEFVFAISQSTNSAGATAPPAKFTVVLNWTSLLKK
jgi:eukaryotic-like serine/threonine-protein kinase